MEPQLVSGFLDFISPKVSSLESYKISLEKYNYLKQFQLPIDVLTFDFLPIDQEKVNVQDAPEDGCYMYGLYLDGCKFNN